MITMEMMIVILVCLGMKHQATHLDFPVHDVWKGGNTPQILLPQLVHVDCRNVITSERHIFLGVQTEGSSAGCDARSLCPETTHIANGVTRLASYDCAAPS